MFKPRPYDPSREDKRTPAQKAATERNFRIFRLRALHAQMCLLTGQRRDQARALVDRELLLLGAKSMAEHGHTFWNRINKQRQKREALAARQQADGKCPDCGASGSLCECIPF